MRGIEKEHRDRAIERMCGDRKGWGGHRRKDNPRTIKTLDATKGKAEDGCIVKTRTSRRQKGASGITG